MKSSVFYRKLFKLLGKRKDININQYKLNYKKGKFDFLRIFSKQILPKDRIIMLCAGIHGNEIAGPITILKYVNKIIDYVHKNNFKIILYSLINPSGFEMRLRYNIDNDKGPAGNNDFLRYELKNKKIIDDIGKSNKFKRWYWSSDKKLKNKLPKETSLMHNLLKRDPLSQVIAVVDLHQDFITPNAPPAAYHYSFSNLKIYKKIVEKIEQILPIFRNKYIGAGFDVGASKSDDNGFIVRHDGTLPDLMYRLGTKHCITVETTGSTPIKIACKVNLLWILGSVDIISKG